MGAVVEPVDALAVVVVAHRADEQRQPAGGVVAERGDDLGDVERRLAQVHEAYGGGHVPEPRSPTPATYRGCQSDEPGETPDDPKNPFAGTPFEQILGAFAAGPDGATPGSPTSARSSASSSS